MFKGEARLVVGFESTDTKALGSKPTLHPSKAGLLPPAVSAKAATDVLGSAT
jgi:hypothetical protein